MRTLLYILIWIVLFTLPQYAGSWYESGFNLFQAIAPLILILFATVLISPGKHRKSLLSILILQIILNAVDSLFYLTPVIYNNTQSVLNCIEILLIFDYVLWGIFGGKLNRDNNHPPDRTGMGASRIRG